MNSLFRIRWANSILFRAASHGFQKRKGVQARDALVTQNARRLLIEVGRESEEESTSARSIAEAWGSPDGTEEIMSAISRGTQYPSILSTGGADDHAEEFHLAQLIGTTWSSGTALPAPTHLPTF